MLCKYKDMFGKVGEGVHSYRILNIAIIDVLLTVLSAFLIHSLLFPRYNFICILLLSFGSGILAHRIFGVRTTVDKLLFG